MATATKITRDEMDSLLRADKGWTVVPATELDGVPEVVYRWLQAEDVADSKGAPTKVWIQVYSSVHPQTGVAHGVGADAIRVCAVRTWANGFKTGFIKAARVHRVEGWRVNLVERVRSVMAESAARIAGMPKAQQAPETLDASGPMRKLVTLFKHAKKHLKRPKLRFVVHLNGKKLRLFLTPAPDVGKNPGAVYVKLANQDYLGKISKQGHFHAGPAVVQSGILGPLVSQLTHVATDPADALGAQGQASGACCFCGKTLTTNESMAVGYGPQCAQHFHLPWGTKAAAEQVANGTHPWELAQ